MLRKMSLMEGERSCQRVRCGHFNGGRIVMLWRWPVKKTEWLLLRWPV